MGTDKGYLPPALFNERSNEKTPDQTQYWSGVFQEGEIVKIKGSLFKITKIIGEGLKLRLSLKEK